MIIRKYVNLDNPGRKPHGNESDPTDDTSDEDPTNPDQNNPIEPGQTPPDSEPIDKRFPRPNGSPNDKTPQDGELTDYPFDRFNLNTDNKN